MSYRITYAAQQYIGDNLGPDNSLPTYAWPGGYPLYYVTDQGSMLCPAHANVEADYSDELIVAADVNYEDASLYCEHGDRIPSAYAEDETGS